MQARLIVTFLLVILVLAGIGLLVLGQARTSAQFYEGSMTDLIAVAELTSSVDDGVSWLGRLASDPSPEKAFQEFQALSDRIMTLRGQLPDQTVEPTSARMMLDLEAMADNFLVEAAAAIYAFQDRDLEQYFKHDREAANIAGYVRDTADRLLAAELNRYRQVYPEVLRRDRRLQMTNLAVLGAVTLVAIVFAWSFASGVTGPLRSLSKAAGRIAGGDLEGPPVPAGSNSADEMHLLGRAFNHMQESLRLHVSELKEKAELERRLQAEELENLQIHSLLREAELRALQSQVNPHFLFNTLNMVAKMAFIEGGERTQTLLETVADLLRYSLRELDRPVTLGQEVAQVQRYMTIQRERFRDRLRFEIAVDDQTFATPTPCLTLQPLVENALIHGIGAREEGGEVHLNIRQNGDMVEAIIRDDGVGIPPERLQQLIEGAGGGAPVAGHTTGLGLQNVRRRLELFYGGAATLELASRAGAGTTVTIRLPRILEG